MAKKKTLIEGFWDRVDETLAEKGIKKSQVAQMIGCDRKTLYEKSATMSPLYLARFCAVTGTDANWLLGITRGEKCGTN